MLNIQAIESLAAEVAEDLGYFGCLTEFVSTASVCDSYQEAEDYLRDSIAAAAETESDTILWSTIY